MTQDKVAAVQAHLPPRGEFVIRDAAIISMDAVVGDHAQADIHVRDGQIIAVGPRLAAPGAEAIDGTRSVVLPGFIDTHWHLWNGLFRGLVSYYKPELGYFPMKALLGKLYRADDIHWAVQRGLAEALNSGMTTVHNWAHNIPSPAHADANIASHIEAGVRGRFSYGWAEGQPEGQPLDLADLERVQREWFGTDRAHLLDLGICVRGPETRTPELRRTAYLEEFRTARRLGLPITMHAAQMRAAQSQAIRLMAEDGLLGPDVQLVHCIHASAEDRRLMAETGTHLSISPLIEMQVGMGFPQTGEMLEAGVLVTLSTDTVAAAGANMFAIMKMTLDVERGRTESTTLSARRVLEMATIDGARDLGIDGHVGSLVPGKRADLIMVKFDRASLSTLPQADWASLLVHHAQPANVDTVVVDGRVLKRHGALTAIDEAAVIAGAEKAVRGLMQRGGLLAGH
ncbi:amidohydrolase family protein [Methylibium sp.]|uniref:amidohydrolase family protein n=1 Tax=Methylibium sp. TaxID=2067992 RepID=UPI003D13DDF8